jgi:hypothetical protein
MSQPLPTSTTSTMELKVTPSTSTAVPTLSFDLSTPTVASEGWKVENVWGGDPSNPVSKRLQDILNRTTGYRILSQLLYRPLVAFLVVVWSIVLWRKTRSAVSWRDAVALVVLIASLVSRNMIVAIGWTAAYAAWSTLADRPWNSTSALLGFEAFVRSLSPAAGSRSSNDLEEPKAETIAVAATTTAEPGSEATVLANSEVEPGLLEKEAGAKEEEQEDCVVCWSSDTPPLRLPCSHLVCLPCLKRLKEAHRFLCPFCRRPLYSFRNPNIYLFQLSVAAVGAQLALTLVCAALRIARRQYIGAAIEVLTKALPAFGMLRGLWNIHSQGEEGYFASTTASTLLGQLAGAVWLCYLTKNGILSVDFATFVDGRWARARKGDWEVYGELACRFVPVVAWVARC